MYWKHLGSVLMTLVVAVKSLDFEVVSYVRGSNYVNKKKIKLNNSYFHDFFVRSKPIEESNIVDAYDTPRIFRGLDFTGCRDSDILKRHTEEDVDYHWITISYEFCVPFFANIQNNYNLEMFMGHWDSKKKNKITPMHWDRDDGFLWCYGGLKYVFLYPPSERHLLYLQQPGTTGGSSTTIPFLIEENNRKDYPKFYKATAYATKMGGGDMLFLPAGWAHHVYSFNHTRCKTFWLI